MVVKLRVYNIEHILFHKIKFIWSGRMIITAFRHRKPSFLLSYYYHYSYYYHSYYYYFSVFPNVTCRKNSVIILEYQKT